MKKDKTNTEYLRQRLLDNASDIDSDSYAALCISEWSNEFEELMRNRLIMGALRYGKLGVSGKPQYDRMQSIIERAERYLKSGNIEDLVDIANIALIEFIEGDHPNKHFKAIDDGMHVKEKENKL